MIFFVISIVMYLLQDFSNKQFCEFVGAPSVGKALIQNGICCLCASLTLLATGRLGEINVEMIILALLFGLTYLGTVFLLLCAFMRGSMGISTLMCNIGMFIAALYGMARFGDDFSAFVAVGYVCMLTAVILSTPTKKNTEKGGIVWFLLALGSGLCNGIVASVKREAVGIFDEDIQTFLTVGFFFAGIIAVIFALSIGKNREEAVAVIKKPRAVVFGVLAGVGTVLANLFQMKSLTVLPSTVVYPLTSGILVVSLWLASVFIYKETKAKTRNVISVVLCVIAVVMANM